jgi:hypothetical protein
MKKKRKVAEDGVADAVKANNADTDTLDKLPSLGMESGVL